MEDGAAAPIRTVAAGIVTAGIATAFVQWLQGVTGQGNEELQVTVDEFHKQGAASVEDLREIHEAGLWGEFDSAKLKITTKAKLINALIKKPRLDDSVASAPLSTSTLPSTTVPAGADALTAIRPCL